jgi:peptidoglycan hydrolase-like protein with peptidoglycan-binding domain
MLNRTRVEQEWWNPFTWLDSDTPSDAPASGSGGGSASTGPAGSGDAYNRWVQDALNRVSGAGLRVDGVLGSRSRAAIVAFQRSRGLDADGKVGSRTEAALVAAGAPRPPATGGGSGGAATPGAAGGSGAGWRNTGGGRFANLPCDTRHDPVPGYVVDTAVPSGPGIETVTARRYALPETAELFRRIGATWAARFPNKARIRVRDISQRGGGLIPPHGSHRIGVDADISLPRRDGGVGGTATNQATYDRDTTRQMLRVIHEVAGDAVCAVWLNDEVLKGEQLCSFQRGHENHIHVRFKLPSR